MDVHGVESERVDGPDVVFVSDVLTMALEGILLLLHLRRRIEIFNGYSPLNRARRISCPDFSNIPSKNAYKTNSP